jgi:acyl-CoA synthetase (AMP-forming)/AMP-acid ligase II
MAQFSVVYESEVLADPDLLERLWVGSPTFFLVPDRSGVSPGWLERAGRRLPRNHRAQRFGILTSGSTGEPRLILGSRARSEDLVRVLNELQDSEPVEEAVCALPISYSYAFINQWLWSHVFDRTLNLTPGFAAPDELKCALDRTENAMLCLVGSQVALIRRYFPNAVFPGVIRLHFAGGRFPQEQVPFLRKRFPNAQIFNNYGCAEAMPRLTLRRAEDAPEASRIGFTIPGVEMKSGADKRLLFRSRYQAVAFIDDSGFHPVGSEDWIPTGDLGDRLPDGSWRLLGRANEVFKRFGEKISLPQLLTTVKSAWGGDAAGYRQIDPAGEPSWVLVLSPEPDQQQLRNVLMAFRKSHTRPHWPLRIESLDFMPLLPNGKPDMLSLKNADSKRLHWRQRI